MLLCRGCGAQGPGRQECTIQVTEGSRSPRDPGDLPAASSSPWSQASPCRGCISSVSASSPEASPRVSSPPWVPLCPNSPGLKRTPCWIKCKVKVLVAQSCPPLCDPMDGSPPGYSVHWILLARILDWVAVSFSMGFSQARDRTQLCHTAGGLYPLSYQGSWIKGPPESKETSTSLIPSARMLFPYKLM